MRPLPEMRLQHRQEHLVDDWTYSGIFNNVASSLSSFFVDFHILSLAIATTRKVASCWQATSLALASHSTMSISTTSESRVWGRKARKSHFLQQMMTADMAPSVARAQDSPRWAADTDFTERSIQISTSPQLRVRNRKLEQIRMDEALARREEEEEEEEEPVGEHEQDEDVAKRRIHDDSAVKASRENGTSLRNRMGYREYLSRSQQKPELASRPFRPRTTQATPSTTAAANREMEVRLRRSKTESAVTEEEGGSSRAPMTVLTDRTTEEERKTEDSHHILRNLSRSISRNRRNSPLKVDVDPEEQIDGEARLFDPHDNKSDKGSIRTQTPPRVDPLTLPTPKVTGAYTETPLHFKNPTPKVDHMTLPTPRITGAFIETPATVKQRSATPDRGRRRTRSREGQVKNTHVRTSAKDDLRKIMDEAGVEDSIMDASTMNSPTLQAAIMEKLSEGGARREKTGSEAVCKDEVTNKPLSKTVSISKVRDVTQHEQISSAKMAIISEAGNVTKHEEISSGKTTGSNALATHDYMTVRIPRLWRHGRPTILGSLVVLATTWYVLELLLSAEYGLDSGYALDAVAHRGWIVPTLLDRSCGSPVRTHAPLLWDLLEMYATGRRSRLLFESDGRVLTSFQRQVLDPWDEVRSGLAVGRCPAGRNEPCRLRG